MCEWAGFEEVLDDAVDCGVEVFGRDGLVEEADALGGGGSRGSGRVSFKSLKLVWRGRSFYSSGTSESELAAGADLAALQALANDAAFADKLSSE